MEAAASDEELMVAYREGDAAALIERRNVLSLDQHHSFGAWQN